MSDLSDLNREEPLHEDLVPHIVEANQTRTGMRMVHHPLVIQIPFYDSMNAFTNQQYLWKKKAVEEALEEKNWSKFIFLHERPYRFEALQKALKRGAGKETWSLIGGVWIDSENIHQHLSGWIEVWQQLLPGRESVMDQEERDALAAMPDVIKIWRGVTHKDAARGLSWTVDRKKAVWFARRFANMEARIPRLVTALVSKEDVLAYFTGRGESEIVAPPHLVIIQTIRKQKDHDYRQAKQIKK